MVNMKKTDFEFLAEFLGGGQEEEEEYGYHEEEDVESLDEDIDLEEVDDGEASLLNKHSKLSKELKRAKKKLSLVEKKSSSKALGHADDRIREGGGRIEGLRRMIGDVEDRMVRMNVKVPVKDDDRGGVGERSADRGGLQKFLKKESKAEKETFHCSTCDVVCPDANALLFHVSGKRHANMTKRREEAEELALARRQSQGLVSIRGGVTWGTVGENEGKGWRGLSEIMNEAEEDKKMLSSTSDACDPSALSSSLPNKPTVKWNSPGLHSLQSKQATLDQGFGVNSFSLGSFMSPSATKKKDKKTQQTQVIPSAVCPWSSGSKPKTLIENFVKHREKKREGSFSFNDILSEERVARGVEDDRGVGVAGGASAKWYIESRVLAEDLDVIQKREENERNHQLLVEEQVAIERQIEEEVKARQNVSKGGEMNQKREKEKEKGKKGQAHKKKGRTSAGLPMPRSVSSCVAKGGKVSENSREAKPSAAAGIASASLPKHPPPDFKFASASSFNPRAVAFVPSSS